eukprot:TRINITY_DN346_c0_g1_i4.p1 TRINITY_DN346_c0_g1~~TRINITY_DN346_c0_g1_i4.p1  ORF type:complete len:355 (+),score=78.02 TRINITY_DN346_c0_g1_i4:65-1129(+)
MSQARITLLGAWFCPWSQRVAIALGEKGLTAGVNYNYIEALKEVDGGFEKHPLLLQSCPNGLVPTLIDERDDVDITGACCTVQRVMKKCKSMCAVPSVGEHNSENYSAILSHADLAEIRSSASQPQPTTDSTQSQTHSLTGHQRRPEDDTESDACTEAKQLLQAARPNSSPASAQHSEKKTVVYESSICLEYIDESIGTPNQLFGRDPRQRACCRMWIDWTNKKFIVPFYRILVAQTEQMKRKCAFELYSALREFDTAIKGNFFYGDQFSAVDIAMFPWVMRLDVIVLHRSDCFKFPTEHEFPRLIAWYKNVLGRPSVRATLPPRKDMLLRAFKRFSDSGVLKSISDNLQSELL